MTRARQNADNVAGDISGVTAGTGLSGGGTSGTVTISADTAVVATTNNTLTMSGKTLTMPRFASGGEIDDANGNELIKFPATVASAINEITVTNATTSGTPSISATGDDTNISLNLVPKGTGTVQAGGVAVATTSGTQTLTNKTIAATSNTLTGVINDTLLSTTGDLVYASSANTPARLGIGSSGQYLSVSGGIPSWTTLSAGGMTSLASGNLPNTLTLSGINQTYQNLVLRVRNARVNAGVSAFTLQLNNITAAGGYNFAYQLFGTTPTNVGSIGGSSFGSIGYIDTNVGNWCEIIFFDYANTTTGNKHIRVHGGSTTTQGRALNYDAWHGTCANITRIDLISATTITGGTYELFGVK